MGDAQKIGDIFGVWMGRHIAIENGVLVSYGNYEDRTIIIGSRSFLFNALYLWTDARGYFFLIRIML